MCDTKKIALMGSYCAEAQKTRFHYAMRKSFCGMYYIPLSDYLSEDFLKTFSEVIKYKIKKIKNIKEKD